MKKTIILGLMLGLIFLTACIAQPISEIKQEKNVDKTVIVKGEVMTSFKIGDFSGYIIEDKNGDEIFIESTELPKEDTTKTIKGTLKEGPLNIGYYIQTK
jgi:hypothetical protein